MKPDRTISTRPSGNVVVVTKLQSGELVAHEYTQCGPFAYLEQDVPGMARYVQIAPDGEPLKLRDRETLEDAVRRMFAEQDIAHGPEWASWAGKWLERLLWGVLAFGVLIAWGSGAAGLATLSVIK